MGRPGAFLEIGRRGHGVRPASATVRDFDDIVVDLPAGEQAEQASRCMNCGVPFCQSGFAFSGDSGATGCPLHNLIPEFNDLLCAGRAAEAAERLALTNPFPEFTGRVCPAPCETACNLGLKDEAVTIHDNERAISDASWTSGVPALPAPAQSAPLASVVGSGPAGLAAAWELTHRGVRVRVYEKDERPGGLLVYGIPNMKLPKWVVKRRVELMEQSGVEFCCGIDAVGLADRIKDESDAVIVACGARVPRALDVPGASLAGVNYAVDYLAQSTRALLEGRPASITAEGADVAVIGGGDTGVDCIATALRQGARSVRQIVRAGIKSAQAEAWMLWPGPRGKREAGYGQREARELFGHDPRLMGCDTVGFVDDGTGHVAAVQVRDAATGTALPDEPAQLVLIAKGFTGAESRVLEAFGLKAGEDEHAEDGCRVYLAGDARTGSSIVASAMADGLQVAARVSEDLRARASID